MCRVTLDLDHKDVCYECSVEMDPSCGVFLLLVTCVFGVGRVGQILSSVLLWLLYFEYVSTSLYSMRHVCMCFLWFTFACLLLEFAARFGVHVCASNFALGEGAKLCPIPAIPKFKKNKIFV